RAIVFGGESTVAQHRGNPAVQVHGPGRSKIILGDDAADDWEAHLDLMERSVLANAGRSCINCSSIWTPRHGREIAEALASRLGPIAPKPVDDPQAALAAFTNVEQARMIDRAIEAAATDPNVREVTAGFREGPRLVAGARCAYLRPTVLHASDPGVQVATAEYMFPFVTVVDCAQDEVLDRIGPTLIGTVLSDDRTFRRACMESPSIDRLNLGAIETVRLDWLQPHEGNLIEFLFRDRALQIA
ncbi:MAG: aldehyde dehydrogenase family protein, partial [Phycisphaerales bacterium]|nr:aldehyde dehydrogenase family protein [Phycisphaerales bacterium]